MKQYTVGWFVDVDADSPEDAARKALTIQREETIATVFNVQDNSTGHCEFIDPERTSVTLQ